MPFRLKNAWSTFQRVGHYTVSSQVAVSLVYLDDMVLFLTSVEQHQDHQQNVLQLLSRASVSLKVNKCSENCIDYFGFVIQPGTLSISMKAIDALHRLQNLTNVTELKFFLGLCNVF